MSDEKHEFNREEYRSTGEGIYRTEQLPTQSVDQLSEVNLTGKTSDASGTVEVVAGTASVRSIITRVDTDVGTASTVNVWFDTGVASTTIRNDNGPTTVKAPFRDGGLGVIPSGSAVVVNAYPDGTVDVSANIRAVPLQ